MFILLDKLIKEALFPHRSEMFPSTVVAFIVIYTLEAFIIIVGNTFTIFVFWTQRSQLKRTYSILINLAVSDLLLGIAEPILLGTAKIAKMTAIPGKEKVLQIHHLHFKSLRRVLQCFFSRLFPWNVFIPFYGLFITERPARGLTFLS